MRNPVLIITLLVLAMILLNSCGSPRARMINNELQGGLPPYARAYDYHISEECDGYGGYLVWMRLTTSGRQIGACMRQPLVNVTSYDILKVVY